jgi:vacuolar-type H+-ATPase subunit F/Vma7
MITVLVVGPRERTAELDAAASQNPSIELLHAAELEEALDRLARNRRIDAVLLLAESDAARMIAETVLEEDPAAPPMFVPYPGSGISGARALVGESAEELLESIARELRADS